MFQIDWLVAPEIDKRSGTRPIRPGVIYTVQGRGFGEFSETCAAWLVGMTDEKKFRIEMTIRDWKPNVINLEGSTDVCNFAVERATQLLPGDCSIYFRNANGEESAVGAIFKPLYDDWLGKATIPFAGGLFGISEEHVALAGKTMDTPAVFQSVTVHVDGGGHAEIHDPLPIRNSYHLWPPNSPNYLECGFHIGLPALQGTNVILKYTIAYPRGIGPPPPVEGLTPWERTGPSGE